jgi:hypothetical protein
MKGGILRREFAGQDKISILKATDLTETHGADIPTSITLDALIELPHPVI